MAFGDLNATVLARIIARQGGGHRVGSWAERREGAHVSRPRELLPHDARPQEAPGSPLPSSFLLRAEDRSSTEKRVKR